MTTLNKHQLQKILSWTAVFLWMLLIFALSAQHGPESSHLSDKTSEIIIEKLNMVFGLNIKTNTTTGFVKAFRFFLRKSAHLGEYFVLGLLVMNAMKTSQVPAFKGFIISVLICVLYAVSDEIHQYFVPGREAQVSDVLIDSVGALGGIWIRTLIKRRNSTSCVE